MAMIRSVHVVPSIYAEGSGISYCVPRLCDALAQNGDEVDLHVLAPAPEVLPRTFRTHAHAMWPFLKRLGISPPMRRSLDSAAQTVPIMHNHSLWMMPNIYPAAATKGTGCRLVTSPHGTLSAYMAGRSRWPKKVVWAWGQGTVLRGSACLHATAELEYRDIRRNKLTAPVAVIPNGVDIPSETTDLGRAGKPRRVLFLGRVHPQKGVEVLLRAWAAVERRYPDWELHVVGPSNDAYERQMLALADRLCVERVTFPGPAYGAAKGDAYRSAELLVLPSYSENFGLVVAEALAHGVPAVATRGAPWSGLDKERCGWWIDIGVEPLTECLRDALSRSPEELREMGATGRDWMRRDFSWKRIGKMLHQTYEWVLGGGPPLAWVITD